MKKRTKNSAVKRSDKIKEFKKQARSWASRHILFLLICIVTFIFDLYCGKLFSCAPLAALSGFADRYAFSHYLKGCLKGIYELNTTLLGISISISSFFFAVVSFMYNNFKDHSFGIPLSDMYVWKYGEDELLEQKRKALLYCEPPLILLLLFKNTFTALIVFSYLLKTFFTIMDHMALVFESETQKEIIREKIMEEIRDAGGDGYDDGTGEFYNLRKVVYLRNKTPDAGPFLLETNQKVLESMKEPVGAVRYSASYYVMASGILKTGLQYPAESSEPEAKYLLTVMKMIGNRLASADIGDEEILKCLSAELGIIAALVNFYRDRGSHIFDELFGGGQSLVYWPGYSEVIMWSVGMLLELIHERRYHAEPLVGYLIGKKLIFGKGELKGKMGKLMQGMCDNYTVLDGYTYREIWKAYSRMKKDCSRDDSSGMWCTYIGFSGFWREK